MQLTPNYKLKKPEETDPIDILDIGENMDILDRELKKKAETSGGDISEMTVKTLEEVKTEFPVPVAGESTKTFLGKVKKFFEDTKSWMTGVCMLGQLVNNCVTNRSDLPLAAAQGKVLMDLYTQLYSDITTVHIFSTDDIIARSTQIKEQSRMEIFQIGKICVAHGSMLVKSFLAGKFIDNIDLFNIAATGLQLMQPTWFSLSDYTGQTCIGCLQSDGKVIFAANPSSELEYRFNFSFLVR